MKNGILRRYPGGTIPKQLARTSVCFPSRFVAGGSRLSLRTQHKSTIGSRSKQPAPGSASESINLIKSHLTRCACVHWEACNESPNVGHKLVQQAAKTDSWQGTQTVPEGDEGSSRLIRGDRTSSDTLRDVRSIPGLSSGTKLQRKLVPWRVWTHTDWGTVMWLKQYHQALMISKTFCVSRFS